MHINASNAVRYTADGQRAAQNHMARKSGNILVHGNVYRKRHWWMRCKEWVCASKGPSVMGKAYYESRHYLQAAITRKAHAAKLIEAKRGQALTTEEFNELVWNSHGVQKRSMREDFIRYNPEHYSDPATTPSRNRRAHWFSRVGHGFHGVCEMFAAPTGMTTNVLRGATLGKVDEQSNRNKGFMLGALGVIGVASHELTSNLKGVIAPFPGALVAYPAVSAAMGLGGTVAGLTSQALITKQDFTEKEIAEETTKMNTNLLKLVTHLKSIKHKPELIKMVGEAMQGKRFFLKKIGRNAVDSNGTPLLLHKALNAIKLNASDTDNMNALFDAVGDYLQIPSQSEGKNASRWSKYVQAKKIKAQERHWVSMLGLVEHNDLEKAPLHLTDARKLLENKSEKCPSYTLEALKPMARVFDAYCGTRLAARLEKWTSSEYLAIKEAERNDPMNAAKYAFTGANMVKNRHQFGPITRCFITLAEAVRVFNMGVILSSNGNLSRLCNNLLYTGNELLGTSPASRTMCNSAGRFFGGAALALIMGLAIPSGVGEIEFGGGDSDPVTISPKSIGVLMCIVAAPTLAFQGLAILVGKLEGWKGDIKPTLNRGDTKAFTW